MQHIYNDIYSLKFSECEAAESVTGRGKPVAVKFNQAPYMIPHIEKRARGGEDAYVSRDDLLVVADGVGGWSL